MSAPKLTSDEVKGAIALLVIIGSFLIMGIYVIRGEIPDATVVAFLSLPLGAVIGFYFGHINGQATALANSAIQLSNQAITASNNRRVDDIGPFPSTPPGNGGPIGQIPVFPSTSPAGGQQ